MISEEKKAELRRRIESYTLLRNIAHAAWHALDDGEELPGGACQISPFDCKALSDALTAFDGGGDFHEVEQVRACDPDTVRALLDDSDEAARLRAENERLREALKLLLDDVQDYEAWQRPCYAVDAARAALSGD